MEENKDLNVVENTDPTVAVEQPVDNPTDNITDPQAKDGEVKPKAIDNGVLGEEAKDNGNEDKPDEKADIVIDEKFVSDELNNLLGETNTDFITKSTLADLQAIGITSPEMAKKALEVVCNGRTQAIIADSQATLEHYGGSEDNVTPEYTKAMDHARMTLNNLEQSVPGIKQVINQAGIQSNLKIVQVLDKLYPLLCDEDKGGNSGADQGVGNKQSLNSILYGKYAAQE